MPLKYPWEEDRSSNGRAWCCHGFRLYQFFGQTSDTQEDRAVVYLMTSASVPWTSTGPTPLGDLTGPYLTGRPIRETETIEDLLAWADDQLDTLLPVGWVETGGAVRFDGGDGRTVLGLEPDFDGRRAWMAGVGAVEAPDEWWERRYPVVPRLLVLLIETAKWGNRLDLDVGMTARADGEVLSVPSAVEVPGDPAPAPVMFTLDEVLQILRNVGVDDTCGACAAVAFTGIGADSHTCGMLDVQVVVDAPERRRRFLDDVLALELIACAGTQLGHDGPVRAAFVELVNAALEQGTLKLSWSGADDAVGGDP